MSTQSGQKMRTLRLTNKTPSIAGTWFGTEPRGTRGLPLGMHNHSGRPLLVLPHREVSQDFPGLETGTVSSSPEGGRGGGRLYACAITSVFERKYKPDVQDL